MALLFTNLTPSPYKMYFFVGVGEVFLFLLSILVASGLNIVEKESGVEAILASLPGNKFKLITYKIMTFFAFAIASLSIYLTVGTVFMKVVHLYSLIIISAPFIFFAVITLITSSLTGSSTIGAGLAGVIWFISLLIERSLLYWLHPFYY
jgi:ABC-type transport system involved in multi-copper enzyme maturation permease subunit